MIENKDISVVVTGKILTETSERGFKTVDVLKSVRSVLPKSVIVLSTWESEPIDGLEYDILIQNKDPGALPFKSQNNTHNRQIISSRCGLSVAKTKFAIGMRSDTLLSSDSFKKYLNKFTSPDYKYKVFESYILTCTKFSRNPRTSGMLFHPSDIFHFDLTSDLLNLWNRDILTIDNPNYSQEFLLAVEQYLWKGCIEQKTNSNINPFNLSIKNIILSECFFINNFIPLSPQEIGIQLPKRLHNSSDNNCYSFTDWQKLHRDYSGRLSFLRKCEVAATAGLLKRGRMAIRPLKNKLLNIHED